MTLATGYASNVVGSQRYASFQRHEAAMREATRFLKSQSKTLKQWRKLLRPDWPLDSSHHKKT